MAELAERQWGRVRYDQVRGLGVGKATINRWCRAGYLHPELPRVYAVGHSGRSTESDLSAALLYAGPGAMLSHQTAIWWLGLLKYPPARIFLSSPRRVLDQREIVVYGRRRLESVLHRDFPVTAPSRTILDFAATGPPDRLRLVLANADFERLLDLDALQSLMGRAVNGTAALRGALTIHLPELARTRSELEVLLITFCEGHRLPIPRSNVRVEGRLVDALWPEARLVVEVDGWQGHRTRAQLENDRQRDLELRIAGYVVLRYTWHQLTGLPNTVATELRRVLGAPRPEADALAARPRLRPSPPAEADALAARPRLMP